jgi:hypothetical protein
MAMERRDYWQLDLEGRQMVFDRLRLVQYGGTYREDMGFHCRTVVFVKTSMYGKWALMAAEPQCTVLCTVVVGVIFVSTRRKVGRSTFKRQAQKSMEAREPH